MARSKFVTAATLLCSLAVCLALVACGKEKGLRINGYEPKTGTYTGGDQVVFSGSGFSADGQLSADVWFGSKKGRAVHFRGDEEMVVTTPGGEAGEVVDIVIRFADGRHKTIEKAFTYIDPAKGMGVGELTGEDKTE